MNMIDYNNMPKICIKCKKGEESGVEIKEFKYSRTRVRGALSNSTTTSVVLISFPVCLSCGEKFRKYQQKEAFYDSSRVYLLITFFVASFLGYGFLGMMFANPQLYAGSGNITLYIVMIIGILLSIIALITLIYYFMYTRNSSNRISLYIKMSQDGKVIIKDKQIEEALVSNLVNKAEEYEKNINVIFCPSCGKKYHKSNIDYCTCGKDLRLLK